MPALGVQLGSMIGYVEACSRKSSRDPNEVGQAWGRVYSDVAVPFGIEKDINAHSDGADDAVSEVVVPLVREKLDTRIHSLFREPVDRRVIESQKIDPKQIGVARDLKIVSEGPANALIQSAMQVSTRSKMLAAGDVSGAGVLFLLMNAMSQLGSSLTGLEAGQYHDVCSHGIMGIASLILMGLLIKRTDSLYEAGRESSLSLRGLVGGKDRYPAWCEVSKKSWERTGE